MRSLIHAVILAGILTDPVAGVRAADQEHDQEQARRALEAGEILPLNQNSPRGATALSWYRG